VPVLWNATMYTLSMFDEWMAHVGRI